MSRSKRWGLAAGIVLALGAAAFVATGAMGGGAKKKKPIIIGVAMDFTSNMSPFDTPAFYAAELEAKKFNAKGGVLGGRKFVFKKCDTQLKKQKECAAQLISQGAAIGMVTCDVEGAAGATQEFINHGKLAVSPCIGTDQQGPKRFGTKGKLAWTLGNPAQSEGAAMAEYGYSKGWRKAIIVKDNALVYFQDIADAFKIRWLQLGGTIVDEQSFASFTNTIGPVITKVAGEKADVICFGTAFGELPQFVAGVRSLGNNTPIINSWGGDGNYWWPSSPKVTNYYYVTYGSIFGDDPVPAVNAEVKAVTTLNGGKLPLTGSFIPGSDTIDALAEAITETHSTSGAKLAKAFSKFRNLPVTSGRISYPDDWHAVIGRSYRVMQVQNNQAKFIKRIVTKKIVTLP
jgi:branched-chain amino acid transport system substrate-binding protein